MTAFRSLVRFALALSADEVEDNEVQQETGDEKVGKRALRRDLKVVLRVDLNAQCNWSVPDSHPAAESAPRRRGA